MTFTFTSWLTLPDRDIAIEVEGEGSVDGDGAIYDRIELRLESCREPDRTDWRDPLPLETALFDTLARRGFYHDEAELALIRADREAGEPDPDYYRL